MTMPNAEPDLQHLSVEPLARQLRQDVARLARFLALLETEAQTLARLHEPHELQALAEAKAGLADALAQDEQARGRLLAALGLSPDEAGRWHAGLDALSQQHPQLAEPWRQVREQAAAAADLNRRNGIALALHLEHVQGALGEIGRISGRTALYDARGKSRPLRQGSAAPRVRAG